MGSGDAYRESFTPTLEGVTEAAIRVGLRARPLRWWRATR